MRKNGFKKNLPALPRREFFDVCIGNHMISSAVWNKQARVNLFRDDQNL